MTAGLFHTMGSVVGVDTLAHCGPQMSDVIINFINVLESEVFQPSWVVTSSSESVRTDN